MKEGRLPDARASSEPTEIPKYFWTHWTKNCNASDIFNHWISIYMSSVLLISVSLFTRYFFVIFL